VCAVLSYMPDKLRMARSTHARVHTHTHTHTQPFWRKTRLSGPGSFLRCLVRGAMPVASASVVKGTGPWPPTRAQFPCPRPRRRRRQVGQGRPLLHARARLVSPSLSLTRMPALSLCRAGKGSTDQGACAAPTPAGIDPSRLAEVQAHLQLLMQGLPPELMQALMMQQRPQ